MAEPYVERIERWRKHHAAQLAAEDGALTWAGLFWLKAGANTIGADPSSDIVLPAGAAPAHVGHLVLQAGQTTLHVADGAPVFVNDARAQTMLMQHDMSGKPTYVVIADLTLFVLKRGEQYAVRLRDKNSEARRDFKGLQWYPAQETYRVAAAFVPYDKPKLIPILNIVGIVTDTPSPGYVVFTLHGQEVCLEPTSRPNGLFFNFKDKTSGVSTYPPGRFLSVDMPRDGRVTLDFNQAYSPPCAFTPFATCPLPPRQNHLSLKIEAGERYNP